MANPKNTTCASLLEYKKSGVDIKAAENFLNNIKPLAKSTIRKGTIGKLGGFAGLFDISKLKYKHPILTSTCDGVGSKLKLATKASYYTNIGIDLVAMCVNDILTTGSEPLFFLDYFATSVFNEKRDNAILQSITQGCQIANCSLLGGETAQIPNLYKENDYDLAGFTLGIVEKNKLLPKANLAEGDHIIGLASSGLHANGFSLIHKLLVDENIDIFSSPVFATNVTFAELFLAPTKIYVKSIFSALKQFNTIKAIAHITGGGFMQNIPRIMPDNLCAKLNLGNFPHNPLFEWLAQKLKFDSQNMLQIFNCGIGITLITAQESSQTICNYLKEQGETPIIIGSLIKKQQSSIELIGNLKGML